VGPLPASAVETVVLTTPPLNIALDFAVVFLAWFFYFTPGTSTTAAIMRIRRGTTASGAQVGATLWQFPVTAAVSTAFSGVYFDTPGAIAGQQYALTIVQVGATVAGTPQDQALLAYML
jgi:hypothetical protein